MSRANQIPGRDEFDAVLQLIQEEAFAYLRSVDERLVRSSAADEAARGFEVASPSEGVGAAAALRELIDRGMEATIASSGPRFFHFVCGGATPAALGADWLAGVIDQIASTWVTSPLGVQLEEVALGWLREWFGLAPESRGVITTGATMANYTVLAAARQWWGARHGVNVAVEGLHGLPKMPVFSSGHLHASAVKSLAMLGVGRGCVTRFSADNTGALDFGALRNALETLEGAPAVLVANAGEVNAGAFDPIAEMADLAEQFGAWLHVDGAFGLFAAMSSRAAHLCAGVERADSATVDGHKWLNVPYDCGFAFVRDATYLAPSFTLVADYLPPPDNPAPMPSNYCAESSRRARGLPVWATLRAYGRDGTAAMIDGCLALAQRMADRVDEANELERLAEVPLNIVCFRFNPGGRSEEELNQLNARLAAAILEDGRVYVGSTQYAGKTALRPAIVNWRTRPEDVDLAVEVIRELAARLAD